MYIWKLTPIHKPYIIEHGNSITLLPLCAAFGPTNWEMAAIANANIHTKQQYTIHEMHTKAEKRAERRNQIVWQQKAPIISTNRWLILTSTFPILRFFFLLFVSWIQIERKWKRIIDRFWSRRLCFIYFVCLWYVVSVFRFGIGRNLIFFFFSSLFWQNVSLHSLHSFASISLCILVGCTDMAACHMNRCIFYNTFTSKLIAYENY